MGRYVVVDQDNFEPGKGLELDKEDVVEREGYRTTEDIVREFQVAGENLANFRREEFDGEYDQKELVLPETRAVGFDVASASQIMAKRKSVEDLKKEILDLQKQAQDLAAEGVQEGSEKSEDK